MGTQGVEELVASTVERYLPTMRACVRGKELFSEHDRLRDQVRFFLKDRYGKVAPVLLYRTSFSTIEDPTERGHTQRIVEAVELAAWTLDRPHDVVVGVAGRWRHFGRRSR